MAVRLEKHGKILATLPLTELVKGNPAKKKQAKINKELKRRNYVAPIVEAEEV